MKTQLGWREIVTVLLVVMGFILGGASVGGDLRDHEEIVGHPLSVQRLDFMVDDIKEIRRMVEDIHARSN